VIVFGEYEELPDLPEYSAARMKAYELLQKHAMWWEPAAVAAAHSDTPHSCTPIVYRINIMRMTGHRATPHQDEPPAPNDTNLKPKSGWWTDILDIWASIPNRLAVSITREG
jgi:hypothetical protein